MKLCCILCLWFPLSEVSQENVLETVNSYSVLYSISHVCSLQILIVICLESSICNFPWLKFVCVCVYMHFHADVTSKLRPRHSPLYWQQHWNSAVSSGVPGCHVVARNCNFTATSIPMLSTRSRWNGMPTAANITADILPIVVLGTGAPKPCKM